MLYLVRSFVMREGFGVRGMNGLSDAGFLGQDLIVFAVKGMQGC